MGSTHNLFLRYVQNYTKALTYYKNIVSNVSQEISRRKNNKKKLQQILTDYFQGYSKLKSEFHLNSSKVQ